MAEQEIQRRTFEFARRVIRVGRALDQDRITRLIASQLVRSGTSIGANVEEAQGAQSKPDFISKMCIARKEAREALYWLRLIEAEGLLPQEKLEGLLQESREITRVVSAIAASAIKTRHLDVPKRPQKPKG